MLFLFLFFAGRSSLKSLWEEHLVPISNDLSNAVTFSQFFAGKDVLLMLIETLDLDDPLCDLGLSEP